MIFWDEVLLPAGGAALPVGALAAVGVSARVRTWMSRELGLRPAEAVPALVVLAAALCLQAFLHLHTEPPASAPRSAYRVLAVLLIPCLIPPPVLGIGRLRRRKAELERER